MSTESHRWVYFPSLGEDCYLDDERQCLVRRLGRVDRLTPQQMAHFCRASLSSLQVATRETNHDRRAQTAGPSSGPLPSASHNKRIPSAGPNDVQPPPSLRSSAAVTPGTRTGESRCQAGEVLREAGNVQWESWTRGRPIEQHQTLLITARDEPPVTEIEWIGQGGCATVSKVRIDGKDKVLALKVYVSNDRTTHVRTAFEREISNLSRIRHPHMVEFYAAYLHDRHPRASEHGILMQPVASHGSLQALLSKCRRIRLNASHQDMQTLRTAYGCLACVVHFLHGENIRHRDLKPSNILVHHGKILLTDFGSSFDGSAGKQMTTYTTHPHGHTVRYAAPEFMTRHPRNQKSDVFALGAVFYEIYNAMADDVPLHEDHYHEMYPTIRTFLSEKSNTGDATRYPVTMIYGMLHPTAQARPSAGQVVDQLDKRYFCEKCLGPTSPTDGDSSDSGQTTLSMEQFDQVMDRLRVQARENGFMMTPSLTSAQRADLSENPQKRLPYIYRVRAALSGSQPGREKDAASSESPDDDDDEDEEDE